MAETTTMQEKVFVNPDHSSQVLYQLSELWRDKKLCDATIEVGPVKVYVHRLVLLAACPYLLTIGGQHDVPVLEVKLPMSVGLEGLNVFLTYLYDGVLNLTTSNLLSVEKISKILKVTGIKRFCQEFRHMDQTVREAVGPSEQFVSDYSINMTDNNMKIIFSEYAGNVGELKRETNEPETEPTEPKRKKMSIDSLSSALQQQGSNNAASSRIQKLTEGSRDRIKVKISRNKEGFTSNTASSNPDSTGDSETTGVHIKQEPISYSDYEDDNTESYDESSRDQTQTDFVRQAPYNTQAFPDEESGFSVTDHHHPQKTDPESEPVGNVDASQVLQKVVKSMPEMALGLDTAAEMGEDNQPQMFMTVNESSKKTPKSKHAVPVASGSKNQMQFTISMSGSEGVPSPTFPIYMTCNMSYNPTLTTPAEPLDRLTPMARIKHYRDKLKQDPDAWEKYKKKEADRKREARKRMTDEQRKRQSEMAKLRRKKRLLNLALAGIDATDLVQRALAAGVTPGQVTPGQMTPRQVTPGQVILGEVAPAQVIPAQVAPGQVTPGHTASGQMTPGHVMSGNLSDGQATDLSGSDFTKSMASPSSSDGYESSMNQSHSMTEDGACSSSIMSPGIPTEMVFIEGLLKERQREFWREEKRKYRARMTDEKRQRVREQDAQYKRERRQIMKDSAGVSSDSWEDSTMSLDTPQVYIKQEPEWIYEDPPEDSEVPGQDYSKPH